MVIDLSHVITSGMITYKGLPAPHICDFLSRESSRQRYAPGTEFHIGQVNMVGNTGTYIDCPFHRYEDGQDFTEMKLERFTHLPTLVFKHDYQEKGLAIGPDLFLGQRLKGKAVLLHTGWSRHWGTDAYYTLHPFLTEEAARYLVIQGVTLVGIDSHNIDDTRSNSRPVHTILLRQEILIVEHLNNLDQVPVDENWYFHAVPPKIKGMGTFPVRAFMSDF